MNVTICDFQYLQSFYLLDVYFLPLPLTFIDVDSFHYHSTPQGETIAVGYESGWFWQSILYLSWLFIFFAVN